MVVSNKIWLKILGQCPHSDALFGFSDINFHVVCNISECECKRSAKFERSKVN